MTPAYYIMLLACYLLLLYFYYYYSCICISIYCSMAFWMIGFDIRGGAAGGGGGGRFVLDLGEGCCWWGLFSRKLRAWVSKEGGG